MCIDKASMMKKNMKKYFFISSITQSCKSFSSVESVETRWMLARIRIRNEGRRKIDEKNREI